MPTIAVDKAALFAELGREYTTEEFDELCFEFGIELDEDTTDSDRPIVNGKQETPQLKIEIPANRYDMLCFEGIALMLNIFNGKSPVPNYRLVAPRNGELQTITVSEDTSKIRPYVSGAILRNVKLDQARYDSLIALQDKLHQNLARQRTLVSIGTHDLDTIQGPFTYEALPPKDVDFVPLNQTKKMSGTELMEFYKDDLHLGRYLYIIRDSPVYPVIYDSKRTVCSLPPIINGNHSKISVNTTNIFIEITATDRTKLEIVNNVLVTMFSQYCQEPFTVEPVKIVSEHNGETRQVPDLAPRKAEAEVKYINSCCGLDLSAEEICKLLGRMSHHATPSKSDKGLINVSIPPTRADVLHQCDIMEDVAIAYGFNDLPRIDPRDQIKFLEAKPLKVNKLSDILREAAGFATFTEVMPLTLCSHDENFGWLKRTDDGNTAVKLANPKTAEYQVVRTSLLPGLLKTFRENKHHSLPQTIFEVGDVTFKDTSRERKARNERHFAAAWCGKDSALETMHGLLDRIMMVMKTAFVTGKEDLQSPGNTIDHYWLDDTKDPAFWQDHAVDIYVMIGGEEKVVGTFGTLRPEVLQNFKLRYPVSTLELNVEVFL